MSQAADSPTTTAHFPQYAHGVKAGERYGRLVAVRADVSDARGNARWLFACDCGKSKIIRASRVRAGVTVSCGCVGVATAGGPKFAPRHGMAKSPEWRAWQNMRRRCEEPTYKNFKCWGGRGIRVCDRWRTFENFYADMGPKPSAQHSLDRIDNNGNYEPGNCRWATRQQQHSNKRQNGGRPRRLA